MKTPIYLDNHATTPVDPRVLEVMLPYFTHKFGNAASRNHAFGWEAEEAVDRARQQVGALVGADAKEIIFTSGATESNNLAILGAAQFLGENGGHIITCRTEHKAVLDPARYLESKGFRVTWLGVDANGSISLEELERAMTPDTLLVSLMAANNEVGTLHPLEEIGKICADKNVLFHTDATQGVGHMNIDVARMNIGLLSMSAHKIYGPKGVGALYVRRRRKPRVKLSPLLHGGGHEWGLRSGTLNVPGIAGFGEAARLISAEGQAETQRILALRERLHQGITERLGHIKLNGHPTLRHPGNLNLSFAYVEGESLLMGMDDVAVSSGSACTSASLEPSYVLRALGVGDDLAHSSIRFGLGRFTTQQEIDHVIQRVTAVVNRLREMSPLYEMAQEGIDLSKVKWQQAH
ncbi:MAG: IscS subfamily cysteine desulfurase [Deltaproteobacteria bacterium]|nr:IscS subfamily cysteine desulfurase [Deltaproteobacteria bacterium]